MIQNVCELCGSSYLVVESIPVFGFLNTLTMLIYFDGKFYDNKFYALSLCFTFFVKHWNNHYFLFKYFLESNK